MIYKCLGCFLFLTSGHLGSVFLSPKTVAVVDEAVEALNSGGPVFGLARVLGMVDTFKSEPSLSAWLVVLPARTSCAACRARAQNVLRHPGEGFPEGAARYHHLHVGRSIEAAMLE